MTARTVLLCIYAISTIALAAYGLVKAAIAVGILGFVLLLLYSLCCVSGRAAQYEEDHYGIRRS